MALIRSLLIKFGMLAVAAGLVFWVGWPLPKEEGQEPGQGNAATPLTQPTATQVPFGSLAGSRVPPQVVVKGTPGHRPQDSKSKVDLNRASTEDLEGLPGIGTILAQRILERRAAKPFQTIDELTDVKGIGRKRLERLRPFLTISRASQPVVAVPSQGKEKL
jgi:competence protein ComEA